MGSAGKAPPRRFQWPPLDAAPSARSLTPSTPKGAPSTAAKTPTPMREFESDWLDPIALPLHRRMLAGAWRPDAFGAYCERCGGDVGEHEQCDFACARCRDSRVPWSRFVRLGRYGRPLNDWICEIKFARAKRLGLEIGALLGERIHRALDDARRFTPTAPPVAPVVVPTPTHFLRRWARGLDHSAVIGQGVASHLRAPVVRALSCRRRPSQRTLSATDRLRNLRGAMRVSERGARALLGRLVVVVDDVSTTGATLREAVRAIQEPFLKAGGRLGPVPEIWVAAASVTPDRPVWVSAPSE